MVLLGHATYSLMVQQHKIVVFISCHISLHACTLYQYMYYLYFCVVNVFTTFIAVHLFHRMHCCISCIHNPNPPRSDVPTTH